MAEQKINHDVLADNWKIAFQALGLAHDTQPNIKQLLYMKDTAIQSVAHVLVDLRESIDASVKQNESLLRVMSTVLRNQAIQIKEHDEQFRNWIRQLSESCEQICMALRDA